VVPASQQSRERNKEDIFKIMIINGNIFKLHSLHMKTARHYSLPESIAMQEVECCDFSGFLYHSSFSSAVFHTFLPFIRVHVSI